MYQAALKHVAGEVCPSCEEKLQKVNPVLVDWFHKVKAIYPMVHISWGYRDKVSQDEAFLKGASKLKWPMSKHNRLPAEAIDLFQIDDKGVASWQPHFMAKLNAQMGSELVWGGNFKSLRDYDHFETPEEPRAA